MTVERRAGLRVVLPLYLAVATALTFVDHRVRTHAEHAYSDYVPAIVAGTAESPGRYRILAPYAFAALDRALPLSEEDNWIVFRWVCLLGALLAGHWYLRVWLRDGAAAATAAVVVAILPLTMTVSWGHPDQYTELILWFLACGSLAYRRPAAFVAVLAVAALNRETSALLVLLCALATRWPWSRRDALWIAAAAATWIAVTAALRLSLGWASYSPWHFSQNLSLLVWWPEGRDLLYRLYSWFFVPLLLVPLWLVVTAWRQQPRLVKVSAAVVVPALFLAGALFSSIIEPRIFTPALAMLAPGIGIALLGRHDDRRDLAAL